MSIVLIGGHKGLLSLLLPVDSYCTFVSGCPTLYLQNEKNGSQRSGALYLRLSGEALWGSQGRAAFGKLNFHPGRKTLRYNQVITYSPL